MNDLLQLKGRFESRKNNMKGGGRKLPSSGCVTLKKMERLLEQLKKVRAYWAVNTLIEGALISVHYVRIIPKSNRVSAFFSVGPQKSNGSIRGARFDKTFSKHIFTHYLELGVLDRTIHDYESCIRFVKDNIQGSISQSVLDNYGIHKDKFSNYGLSYTTFVGFIADSFYVESFGIDNYSDEIDDAAIVSIYQTNVQTNKLLSDLGIDMPDIKKIDETTFLLTKEEIAILKSKAPYLISMSTIDWAKLTIDDFETEEQSVIQIPDPTNEPVIGVIDTLFDKSVYFGEWVEYHLMLPEDIPIESADYNHGTAVSSIIVDGPSINPELDDGCGRFRVRHFGVAKATQFSSFSILRQIREIVATNTDIKVWNLSLGSDMEINQNFISPEGAQLDKLQSEYDIVFVVAGTNKRHRNVVKIGAPADSLNSIVVNSVRSDNTPASYTRQGPVLSFFCKPDICCYGGDKGEYIRVCEPTGEALVAGTSYAAPWISRKLAYLIHTLGFSREIAKALLIDSAAGWNTDMSQKYSVGYGVVPKRIDDVVKSNDDEIKFFMTGASDEYEVYTYNIPVPVVKDAHPFYARATMVYFPRCTRNQGVDYTNTEMDIKFGRVKDDDGTPSVQSINNDTQGGGCYVKENEARQIFRKWDNVKHICEAIKSRAVPRKKYNEGFWGLSVTTKERQKTTRDRNIPFGVVITLKEMNGKNRIDDFIKMCMMRGWIVNRIDVDNMVDVYSKAEEDVDFD